MHKHHGHTENKTKEYTKFVIVITVISALAYLHANWRGLDGMQFMQSFMGVFFIVFSAFKLSNLKVFAYGFQEYDLVAKRSLFYSFSYPFIQLLLGGVYLFGANNLAINIFVLILSLVSGLGVIRSIKSGKVVHCVCLGNVIKLPLSTVTLVEDFGMAAMALAMILIR